MPIKATYRDVALADALHHIPKAAKAEGLKPKAVETLWVALKEPDRLGLIAFAGSPKSDGAGLPEWRAAFPAQFAEHSDEEASALIRIAVAVAGGAIREQDDSLTDTKATP